MYFSPTFVRTAKYGEHHISGGCVEYVKSSTPAHCMPVHCIRVCKIFRWNFSHAIKTFVAAKMRAHVRQGAWHSIVFRVRRLHIRQCHHLCCVRRHYHVIKSMHPRFTAHHQTRIFIFTWRVIVSVSVNCLLFGRKIWKCNRVASDEKTLLGFGNLIAQRPPKGETGASAVLQPLHWHGVTDSGFLQIREWVRGERPPPQFKAHADVVTILIPCIPKRSIKWKILVTMNDSGLSRPLSTLCHFPIDFSQLFYCFIRLSTRSLFIVRK